MKTNNALQNHAFNIPALQDILNTLPHGGGNGAGMWAASWYLYENQEFIGTVYFVPNTSSLANTRDKLQWPPTQRKFSQKLGDYTYLGVSGTLWVYRNNGHKLPVDL